MILHTGDGLSVLHFGGPDIPFCLTGGPKILRPGGLSILQVDTPYDGGPSILHFGGPDIPLSTTGGPKILHALSDGGQRILHASF